MRALIAVLKREKPVAEDAFLKSNQVSHWYDLLDLSQKRAQWITPEVEGVFAGIFADRAKARWENAFQSDGPAEAYRKFVKDSKSPVKIKTLNQLLDKPYNFHGKRLRRALGPLLSQVRIVLNKSLPSRTEILRLIGVVKFSSLRSSTFNLGEIKTRDPNTFALLADYKKRSDQAQGRIDSLLRGAADGVTADLAAKLRDCFGESPQLSAATKSLLSFITRP